MSNITFRKSPPAVGPDEVSQLEQQLGITLPADYREFLLTTNGGRPKPNVFPIQENSSGDRGIIHQLYGIVAGNHNNLADVAARFRERVPAELLPIGRDPGGNLLLLTV